jgi:hypothetical protein
MTYHDSGGWRLSRRAPQHAAALRLASPLRSHVQRALRLFVTAGMWAAGLCLVIGLIVLVATAAAPGSGQSTLAAARQAPAVGRADTLTARPASTGHVTAERVLGAFSGRGNVTTRQFSVKPHKRWELRWSYLCPAQAGQLIVEDADGSSAGGASIDQSGISGTGATWLTSARTKHQLVVISTCSWTMKAVQDR